MHALSGKNKAFKANLNINLTILKTFCDKIPKGKFCENFLAIIALGFNPERK